MTTRASWTRRTPFGATYSTPPACPSPAVSTRSTLQPVRRSRFPVASASGTEESAGCHLSSVNEPKPLLQAVYVVAGRPADGTLFLPAGTACGGRPSASVGWRESSPDREGRGGGVG